MYSRTITLRDIAKQANVSYATASRALAGNPNVAEKTRKLICQIASELGYTPNAMARGLVNARTNNIGMIIPDAMNPFYSEVIKGIRHHANDLGYNIFLCDTDGNIEKERKFVQDLFSQHAAGIIIQPIGQDLSHIFRYYPPESPLVFLSYQPEVKNCKFVETDQFALGYIAANYLINIGHRKIYFMGYDYNLKTTIRRYEGYAEAMEAHQLSPFKPDMDLIKEPIDIEEIGYTSTQRLLMENHIPTAIVVYNDLMALGVMSAVEDYGLSVPKHVSIVGMDDIYLSRLKRINLTSVAQDKEALGNWCSRILINTIENPEHMETNSMVLEPKLILRKSCIAP